MSGNDADLKRALKLAARAALARRSLLDFCQFVNPRYQRPPHIEYLGQKLEALERGDIKRLMVFLPPRHGKSELGSGMFPAWFLGRDPQRKVILTSYAATLAETFSVQNRDMIQYNPMWALVFPNATLSSTVRSVEKWALRGQRESMIAAGVGGPITGFGADLLIIDDPVKNYEEASSKSTKEKQFKWYTTTARTRLQRDGRVFIIMTRWVEDDLAGMILDSDEGREFEVVHLPAESFGVAEDYPDGVPPEIARSTAFPDALGRRKGEPLWPEFGFDRDFLDSARQSLHVDYHALYQGTPTAPAGERFRRADFRVDPDLSGGGWLCTARQRSWDLAWSEATTADWTVGILMELWENKSGEWLIRIKDIVRWKSYQVVDRVMEQCLVDGPEVEQVLESVAVQNVAFQSIRRDERMWNIRMRGYQPVTDKIVRAESTIRLASRGKLWLASGDWNDEFLDELIMFPSGRYNDQVDALTQGINAWASLLDAIVMRSRTASVERRKADLPWELRPERVVVVDRLGWRVSSPSSVFRS